jgi:hypothetical protein
MQEKWAEKGISGALFSYRVNAVTKIKGGRGTARMWIGVVKSHYLTLTAVVSGIFLALLAAFIGSLYSFDYFAGQSSPAGLFYLHPAMEVFGFLTLFILGVSYAVLPKFKNAELSHRGTATLSIVLLVAANILWIYRNAMFQASGDILLLLASAISFALLAPILGKPSGPLAIAEPFFWLSLISLIVAGFMKLNFNLFMNRTGWSSFPFLEITLFGFPAMMVFGVETRTIHFRFVKLSKQSLAISYLVASASLIMTILWMIIPQDGSYFLMILVTILWSLSSFFFLYGIKIFYYYVEPNTMKRMNERDRIRYFYFSKASSIAGAWLVAGVLFALLYVLMVSVHSPNAEWVRDAFIHGLGVGFLPVSMMAYTPTLLTAVLARKAPYRGLSIIPVLMYTLGNAWRILVDVFNAAGVNYLSSSAPYSTLLSAAGFAMFVVMLIRLR